MHLYLPVAPAYKSKSQQIRVSSEPWVAKWVFCPNCGEDNLHSYENNRQVADFYCSVCRHEYELKSKAGSLGRKVNDGAYSTMIERINGTNSPSFFFLNYDRGTRAITDLLVVPGFYFTTPIIERRKPLASTARRAGWVGCNILIDRLPLASRIHYVKAGVERPKNQVRHTWEKLRFLERVTRQEQKTWLLDIMDCIEMLGEREFTLAQIYAYEDYLQARHPQNAHVRDKIRQQLQVLRDQGYLKFLGSGVYQVN